MNRNDGHACRWRRRRRVQPSSSKSATPMPIPLPTWARMPDAAETSAKVPSPLLWKSDVRQALVLLRVAVVGRLGSPQTGSWRGIPDDVVGDEEVEPPVAVEVDEGGGDRPQRAVLRVAAREAGGLGDVLEGAVAVVAEERVAAQAGDEEVGVAVVVVVAGGDAEVVAPPGHARRLGHVGEGAVARCCGRGGSSMRGPSSPRRAMRRAVHDVDVEPAVVVVVEEGHARDHRLRLVLARRAAGVGHEAHAARGGDLLEHDGVDPGGSAAAPAASSDSRREAFEVARKAGRR